MKTAALKQKIEAIRTHTKVANVNLVAAAITTNPADRAYYFRNAIERVALATKGVRDAELIAAQAKKKGGRK